VRLKNRTGSHPSLHRLGQNLLATYTFIRMCIDMPPFAKSGPPRLFKTLADPTRLRLLNLLGCGETCVCELTATLQVVQPKVSRHLAQLKRARLVEARREGKWMHYRWAKRGDPLVRHVLLGLRQWMASDQRMKSERQRRGRVCCQKKARNCRATASVAVPPSLGRRSARPTRQMNRAVGNRL
jgi:ArsR family transcriptional regulator